MNLYICRYIVKINKEEESRVKFFNNIESAKKHMKIITNHYAYIGGGCIEILPSDEDGEYNAKESKIIAYDKSVLKGVETYGR